MTIAVDMGRKATKTNHDLSIRVSSSEVYTLVFYLAIVNKILSHCRSWLAGLYKTQVNITC